MALEITKTQNLAQTCSRHFFYTLLGCIIFTGIFLLAVLFTPLYVYRWLITKIIAPRFRPRIGEAVNVTGQFLAAELSVLSSTSADSQLKVRSPRCAVVVPLTFSGNITTEQLSEVITDGWLTTRDGDTELRYPEFKQYIERWMGFMFWKQDNNFSLENHLHAHNIPEQATVEESEKCVNNLIETLLNKPFHPKRSPWEAHILQNYKNPAFLSSECTEYSDKSMTVLIFRFHHGMVDGYSILYALVEGLMGYKLESVKIAKPKKTERTLTDDCCGCIFRFQRWTYLLYRLLYDTGYFTIVYWCNREANNSWNMADNKKEWAQLYDKSELIPVQKIKFVKNQLDVSFTGVLLSCIAAGTAENLKVKEFKAISKLPFGSIVPLEGHPNKLRNHAVATMIELNIQPNLDPVQRLIETDQDFVDARHNSQLPFMMWLLGRVFSSPVVPVSRFFCRNRLFPAILSNFPGPGINIEFGDRKILAMDACAGGLEGVAGVVFTVVSYGNYVRIGVTAEGATMNRLELCRLIKCIENELDVLYEHAKNLETNTTDSNNES